MLIEDRLNRTRTPTAIRKQRDWPHLAYQPTAKKISVVVHAGHDANCNINADFYWLCYISASAQDVLRDASAAVLLYGDASCSMPTSAAGVESIRMQLGFRIRLPWQLAQTVGALAR